MIRVIVVLLFVLGFCNGQINHDFPSMQPELAAPLVTACCEIPKQSHMELQECIDNAVYSSNFLLKASSLKTDVSIYTYVTDNILPYSAYATSINAAYAEQNRYDFHIVGRDHYRHSDNNFAAEYKSSTDPRWNKVHMLLEALKSEEVGSNRYIVWIDADLIVLDLGMRIEKIGQEFPDVDLIMSRDMVHAEFVSNSGFIIVRRSEWSIAFFEQWWSSYDRSKCCDQNAFTWLYDKFDQSNLGHVKLLRADAINSNFPAWQNQKEFNQVLHLAGASTLFRRPIFSDAWSEICNAAYGQYSIENNKNSIWKEVESLYTSDDNIGMKELIQRETHRLPNQLHVDVPHLLSYIVELGDTRVEAVTKLMGKVIAINCIGNNRRPETQDFVLGRVHMSKNITLKHHPDTNYEDYDNDDLKSNNMAITDRLVNIISAMELIIETSSKLDDYLKNDHDDTRDFMNDVRTRRTKPDQINPSQIEDEAALNIRRWLHANYRGIALDLIDIIESIEMHSIQLSENELDLISTIMEICKVHMDINISEVDNDNNKKQRNAPNNLYIVTLEILKDSISSGFQLVLALDRFVSISSYLEKRRTLIDIGDSFFNAMEKYVPLKLLPKIHYYKFKQNQLLSSTFTAKEVLHMQDTNIMFQNGILHMQRAIKNWKLMTKSNYYGSDYVLADPFKEGAEVMNSLGTLQCMNKDYTHGIHNLKECSDLQEQTLDGYKAIRIATRKDIRAGQAALAETLLNLGICLIEKYSLRGVKMREEKVNEIISANAYIGRSLALMSKIQEAGEGPDVAVAMENAQDQYQVSSKLLDQVQMNNAIGGSVTGFGSNLTERNDYIDKNLCIKGSCQKIEKDLSHIHDPDQRNIAENGFLPGVKYTMGPNGVRKINDNDGPDTAVLMADLDSAKRGNGLQVLSEFGTLKDNLLPPPYEGDEGASRKIFRRPLKSF